MGGKKALFSGVSGVTNWRYFVRSSLAYMDMERSGGKILFWCLVWRGSVIPESRYSNIRNLLQNIHKHNTCSSFLVHPYCALYHGAMKWGVGVSCSIERLSTYRYQITCLNSSKTTDDLEHPQPRSRSLRCKSYDWTHSFSLLWYLTSQKTVVIIAAEKKLILS